jgi:hypothetical protein
MIEDSPPATASADEERSEGGKAWLVRAVTWVSDEVVCEGSQVAVGSSFNDAGEQRH